MGRYRKIEVGTWVDDGFLRLSPPPPNGRYLWFYLLTNPDTVNIPGLYRSGEAAMAEALGWPLKGFREAFAEASTQGMVKGDWEARVVWLPNAIKYNPPESPNVVKSWRIQWGEIPSCPLKIEAYHTLKAFLEAFGEAFLKAFLEACPKPYGKASPNQEQEQEQEQEEEERPRSDIEHLNASDAAQAERADALALAERLRQAILRNKPDARVPPTNHAWARAMRLMLDRDHRSPERIAAVIDWCTADAFWSRNILSADKLRLQFDRLELSMRDPNGGPWGGGPELPTEGIAYAGFMQVRIPSRS